ncbi:phage tail tip lysozyme [Collinsella aerofaciens]|uniref:phage tail tip lysozyme n=1 Tax=Collinsella aerofaciens TaxID=74426 RepID=UPI003D7B3B3F
MPDASKNGNSSAASDSKNSSVAGVSSEIERKRQAAAAYDDGMRRASDNAADFSRHTEAVGSGYSAGAGAVNTVNPAVSAAQEPQHATPSPSALNFSTQDTFGTSFGDRRSDQDGFKAGMNTGVDQLGQAGVALSSEFNTDMAATVQADARDAFSGAYDTGRTGFDQTAGIAGQGFGQPQQAVPSVAAQPIQQVPSAFSSRMEQQASGSPFADGAARRTATQQNMMTSIDGVDAAGIAGSRDFIEGTAVSVQADARDAFSGAYDTGRTGFDQPAGGPGQNPSSPQAGQQSFGGAASMSGGNAPAEDKAVSVSETVGFGAQRSSSASWASADMFSSDAAKDVHLSKKIQENLDNSKSAYVQAKQDFAAAEKDALETLDASGWSSSNQASAFSDSAARAEGFKDGLGTSADGIERAGVSDSRDFGFMTQTEREAAGGASKHVGKPHGGDAADEKTAAVSKYSDAPESVRSAARKVVTEKENVRKASDEMVASHREASEFITKAEQRAKTAANFKSAAANALVNSAVASIGDDSVSGAAIRSSARAAVAAGRSIKASRAAGKQVGARGFFSSSAEAAKSAVFAFDEEGSLDGLEKADEAVRTGRYIRGKAKDFKAARAKAKGGSKSQLMSQAEKKAARAAEDGQRAAFSKSMQRRSMSIAKAKAAASEAAEAEQKASLIGKVINGLMAAGKQAVQAIVAFIQSIASYLAGLIGSVVAALGGGMVAVIAAVVLLIILFVVALYCDPSQATVQGLNETESQVATFFREKGLDDLQIAAIMGNMYGESGMKSGETENNGAESNPNVGIGLCQWTGPRHTGLVNYAKSVGKSWTDVSTQLNFFWEHDSRCYTKQWGGVTYPIGPYRSPVDPEDPPVGTQVSGTKSAFVATDDLRDAVRQFCYGWESPGQPRFSTRYEAADRYLNALQNGGDSDGDHGGNGGAPQIAGASARQQTVVNMCYSTPSPGLNWCAAWVTNVFRASGVGYYGGNACDMYSAWCHSSNRNELKVGMIIADSSHSGTGTPGLLYGHVGIYIGNNKVMSNEGTITIKSLDSFVRFYGTGSGCKWGWIGGIDLSK